MKTRLLNGAFYGLAWFVIVHFGVKGSFWIPFSTFALSYAAQIYLFSKSDRNSLLVSGPLSVYSLGLGLIQELLFVHFSLLSYPGQGLFPPFWLLCLYPLFSLILNSALSFLNRSLLLAFVFGGLDALPSYFSGERMGAVTFSASKLYPIAFIAWGVFTVLLIVLNRKLVTLQEKYSQAKEPITVFFDGSCPVCAGEMESLKKREQTGKIIYKAPKSEEELRKLTTQFTYKESMEKIHAIKANGEILKGTDVLAELYARTNLPSFAIWLQAPIFRQIFIGCYALWARFRIRH